MSQRDPDGRHAEKTEFAEKLGLMNKRWESISSDVVERLKNLELMQVKWEEYDRGVSHVLQWFSDQELRVKKHHRIGHEVGVQQAVKDCKVLEEQLKGKEAEIDHLKKLGTSLMEAKRGSPGSIRGVLETVDTINQRWASLDHQVCQLQNTLDDILRQWDLYHHALQTVNLALTEAEYSQSRFNQASGDINTFTDQAQKLKVC